MSAARIRSPVEDGAVSSRGRAAPIRPTADGLRVCAAYRSTAARTAEPRHTGEVRMNEKRKLRVAAVTRGGAPLSQRSERIRAREGIAESHREPDVAAGPVQLLHGRRAGIAHVADCQRPAGPT